MLCLRYALTVTVRPLRVREISLVFLLLSVGMFYYCLTLFVLRMHTLLVGAILVVGDVRVRTPFSRLLMWQHAPGHRCCHVHAVQHSWHDTAHILCHNTQPVGVKLW